MAVRIWGHANKISFPLQSKYISNIPYPQLIAVNRRGGGNKQWQKFFKTNILKEAVDHHYGLTALMICEYVESLARN